MTTTELFDLLSFESGLNAVSIISQTELKDNATFIVATLEYAGQTLTVPFIHYSGEDFIFTPSDWQGYTPKSPDDIEDVEWRVNDTSHTAIMLGGLPRIFI